MQRNATKGPGKRRWRFRGLCADARALGVHRNSLYKVLAGVWKLKGLRARYDALKAEQAQSAARISSTRTSAAGRTSVAPYSKKFALGGRTRLGDPSEFAGGEPADTNK